MGRPQAIVTDIEGTTSSLDFVHEVLFPYSRSRLADHVRANAASLREVLGAVDRAAGQTLDLDAQIALLLEWHDADRKIGPLKDVQAAIWAEGFRSRAFTGHIYPDAVAALRRWHGAGIALYVYSSGSVAAQKLLFGHSDAGDLTPLFAGHFDTNVGAKREVASYRAIAGAIGFDPADILFLSDVAAELAAAQAAGLRVILVARDGDPGTEDYPRVASFDAIEPWLLPA
jgi:enolase-phosphatase E1